jgi:hypothetical protein
VRLDGRLGSPFRGWECDQPCPVHERLASGHLGEENNEHADCADDRGDSHKSTASLASLELEDRLKRALVGFGIIGGRLMVDHALDPRRILRILRRRQGHPSPPSRRPMGGADVRRPVERRHSPSQPGAGRR